jgi:Uncharacterized enzyme of heme biosynthesis
VLWAWVAVLAIAVALAAAWLDARHGQRELRVELAKRLAEIESAQQATRAVVKDAQENVRDAQAKIALLENRLGESQAQQAALEALYRELSPSRDEWALTEVEQVLMLASQQLQLAGTSAARLQRCRSPTPNCSGSIVRNSSRCAGRWRATWTG